MKTKSKFLPSIILILVLTALSWVFTFFGISDGNPIMSSFVFFLAIVAVIGSLSGKIAMSKNESVLVFLSFLVKAGYAVFQYGKNDLASPNLTLDSKGFWMVASQYYGGVFDREYTYYPHLLNIEFHLFGKNILSCIFFNILLTTLMILLVIALLNRYNVSGKTRSAAIFLTAFFPYSIIVTNNLWRESVYFFFLTASFFKYIDYIRSDKFIDLLLALIISIPVMLLHIGYFPLILAYLIDGLLHDRAKPGVIRVRKLLVCGLFLAFIVFAFSFDSVDTYISRNNAGLIDGIIDRITGGTEDESVAAAGSLYLPNIRINSVGTLLLYTPLKFIYYLLSPMPMDWRNLTDVVAFLLDGCIHCFLIGYGIKHLIDEKKKKCCAEKEETRIVKIGVYAAVFCALMFCLGTTAAGTAIRHRSVMIGIEIIIFALASLIGKGSVPTDPLPREAHGADEVK